MSKNLNGEIAEVEYDSTLRERPFFSASKGLGSHLFYAHREEIARTGCVKLGGRTIPVPTYYKNLFQDFSVDSVASREEFRIKQFQEIMSTAKSLGFQDYDSYMLYSRKAKELSLEKQFLNKGIPVIPSYNNYQSLGDGYMSPKIKRSFYA